MRVYPDDHYRHEKGMIGVKSIGVWGCDGCETRGEGGEGARGGIRGIGRTEKSSRHQRGILGGCGREAMSCGDFVLAGSGSMVVIMVEKAREGLVVGGWEVWCGVFTRQRHGSSEGGGCSRARHQQEWRRRKCLERRCEQEQNQEQDEQG
jgi:hypothetical protein